MIFLLFVYASKDRELQKMTRKAERIGMFIVFCLLAIFGLAAGVARSGDRPRYEGGVVGESGSPLLEGTLSEKGQTVDPATVRAYNAPHVWQPQAPPAAAATRPYRTKIVSYCDEWGRHGASGHGGGPEAWRHARRKNELAVMNKPARGAEPWPYTRRRDRDVDGDGKTDDDMVVSLPWSMDQMLGIYPWPHGGLFPERSCQVFYGGVYTYNALSGKSKWTFETGKPVRSSPGVASKSGLVYFGCNDGKVYCLNAKTGEKKWEYAAGGAVISSPWPAGGVVYVGSDDGHIYALENE